MTLTTIARRVALAAAVTLLLAATGVADAAPGGGKGKPGTTAHPPADVSVTLVVRVVHQGMPPEERTCPVRVPAGANAVAVLDDAVATACIQSYVLESVCCWARRIDCIDDRCAERTTVGVWPTVTIAKEWQLRENGTMNQYVEYVYADDGDVLTATYNSFPRLSLSTLLGW